MDEKMNLTIVYIDDEVKMQNDAFLDDISDIVEEIRYFEKPVEGLAYVKQHIDKNIVVILDWKFSSSVIQGTDILKDISEISVLVPVIVFTGAKIDVGEANKMFNGHAFSCISKDADTATLVNAIHNAYDRILNDIRSVMEKWILKQDEEKRNRPYMRNGNTIYTLNDILISIRRQDDLGKETTRGILSLATELFTNNMREK